MTLGSAGAAGVRTEAPLADDPAHAPPSPEQLRGARRIDKSTNSV
jgi:hypothetical protein